MKSRHLNMIAIGGSIGAGFFVGSGGALTRGGPASLLICFLITGVMIFNVVYALGELAVMYPVSGGFYTYSVRFVSLSILRQYGLCEADKCDRLILHGVSLWVGTM
jgi:amino acid transporter